MIGHLLNRQIGLTRPIKLPVESCHTTQSHLKRTISEQSAVDRFFHLTRRHSRTIKVILETEPGVQTESDISFLNCLHHGLSFTDRAGHGLLAPDVLARFGRRDRHVSVPVRRGAGVDDIDIFASNHLTEIVIHLCVLVSLLDGLLGALLETLGIDIAESENSARHIQMRLTDSPATQNPACQFFRRRRLPVEPEDSTGHDGNGGE